MSKKATELYEESLKVGNIVKLLSTYYEFHKQTDEEGIPNELYGHALALLNMDRTGNLEVTTIRSNFLDTANAMFTELPYSEEKTIELISNDMLDLADEAYTEAMNVLMSDNVKNVDEKKETFVLQLVDNMRMAANKEPKKVIDKLVFVSYNLVVVFTWTGKSPISL